jgi:hypothetical protein
MPGPKPRGDHALTPAERQAAYRARLKAAPADPEVEKQSATLRAQVATLQAENATLRGQLAQARAAPQAKPSVNASLDAVVQARINKHYNEVLLPLIGEKLRKAELLLAHRKPFTVAEYMSILRALHPDASNQEWRQEAFVLIKSREVLLRPEEREKPLSSGLPRTLDELLARRRTAPRKRASPRRPASNRSAIAAEAEC